MREDHGQSNANDMMGSDQPVDKHDLSAPLGMANDDDDETSIHIILDCSTNVYNYVLHH